MATWYIRARKHSSMVTNLRCKMTFMGSSFLASSPPHGLWAMTTMMPAVRPSACGLYIDDLPFSHFLVTEEFDRPETWKGESTHVPALCVFSLCESSSFSTKKQRSSSISWYEILDQIFIINLLQDIIFKCYCCQYIQSFLCHSRTQVGFQQTSV